MRSAILMTILALSLTVWSFSASAQRVQDGSYSTIAYINDDGRVQNSSYSTIGYIQKDGRVQNSSYSTIGYIQGDGRVQNSNYSTIGYVKGVPMRWAALYFFFKFF